MKANTSYLDHVFRFFNVGSKQNQASFPSIILHDADYYEIEFRDVSFAYPGSNRLALEHISFTFHSGEKLALVGENGAGKTTFIKLLLRLYTPTHGVIYLNGIDILQCSKISNSFLSLVLIISQ